MQKFSYLWNFLLSLQSEIACSGAICDIKIIKENMDCGMKCAKFISKRLHTYTEIVLLDVCSAVMTTAESIQKG